MMNTLPLRLTILHLAQRFRTDGETFMTKLLATLHVLHSQGFDYTRSSSIRLADSYTDRPIRGQSGVEVLLR